MHDDDGCAEEGDDTPGFDLYNPATWLVSAAEGEEDEAKQSSKQRLVLPEKRPRHGGKIFPDEYTESDPMTDVEVHWANHIHDAVEYQRTSPPKNSPTKVGVGVERASPPASPLDDPYAVQPYVVSAAQLTQEEEDAKAAERTALARKRLASERAKYTIIGSELATLDPEVLLKAMVSPAVVSFIQPPTCVNALGRDGGATVWWAYNLDSVAAEARVSAWEITRYRLDDGVWTSKGLTVIKDPQEVELCRCAVPGLQNGSRYRFSVMGRNMRGRGFESPLSDAVLVEADLPPGWFRFYDAERDKFYYSNVKTKHTSWTRPDLDPFYLHEDIVLLFSDAERSHLRELYVECIHMHTHISQHAFKAILLECGEVVGVRKIDRYFFEFSTGGRHFIDAWPVFMLVVAAIKRRAVRRSEAQHCQRCQACSVCLPCLLYDNATCCARLSFLALLDRRWAEDETEKNKFGAWVMEWSAVGERNQFRNTRTGDITWEAPRELRFYLPRRMEDKLLTMYSPQDLEDLKMRFSKFDLDGSGAIDRVEFKMLLEDMGIRARDSVRERLIREIDLNGNGAIEFHEFCFLMMNLNSPKWSFLKPAPPPASATASASSAHGSAADSADKADSADSAPAPGCCVCVVSAYHNVQADYRAAVGRGDVCIDRFLLCRRPPSEHGSHCMCGCRRLLPDDVYYWPCVKGEEEPITWSSTCPYCD